MEILLKRDTNTKSNASREIHSIYEIQSGSHKFEEFLNLEKLLKPQNGNMKRSGGNFNGMNSDHVMRSMIREREWKIGMDWESTIVLDQQRK